MAESRQTSPAAAVGIPAMNAVDDADPPRRASPILHEERKLFHMNGDGVNYENLAMYRKNGFHPIILGDVLPKPGTCENDQSKAPRYYVIQKLGFGAFATVWLARDFLECRYVALKVCCGVDKPTFSRETNILYGIQQSDRAHPGFDNILTLYEAFIISGPNGFHECLVTEVVAPLEGLGISGGWSKQDILRQIASAVLLLHSQGIAHGDLHDYNFGVAVPGLQEMSEEDIQDFCLGDQEVIPVIPRDPMFPRDTVPAYVTPSALLGAFLTDKGQYPKPVSGTIKLLDFGRAFSVDRSPRHLPGGAPFHIRPPEVITYDITDGKAGTVWSKEADIWALGCSMHSGYLVDQNGFRDFYQRLGNALRTGGPPPEEWLEYLDLERLSGWISSELPESRPILSKDQLISELSEAAAKGWGDRGQYSANAQHREFIDLIRRMVVTDPGARLDIAEVLAHPSLRREA